MNFIGMSTSFQTLTITQIKEEVPGVKTFVFGGEEAESIVYQPGQYLTLVVLKGEQEVRRSYSITSSPVLQEPLSIGVKRIANGVLSRQLIDHAKVGDEVLTIGAGGFFTLPPEAEERFGQVFFWAAGSGITPIFSLLKTVLFGYPSMAAVLVYSNHSPQDTIFKQQLDALAERFPERLVIHYLFSTNPRLDQARLHKSLLEELVSQYAVVLLSEILCYICGPESYRRLCVYGLRELKVPLENIRQENFNSVKVTLKVEPPDTRRHQVTLLYKKQAYPLQVQFPDTILQAARKAKIFLPYSCETGKCGSCAAQCLQGKVWMSYNEVLSDREVARGLTLTCVGYPVGGDVVLQVL
ncbi:oxidoreductase [Rufibacter radiotolerans]|uniref:Oxidoreductase n=1 Tax=Rufibacter radiotolerans TaxID=1379910 RepID=A0A0H4W5Z4_9BACT|nr:ferredoxin--NADP reductase [Rufibacter radiotolerans]AKQ45856.1 oxidoreductase [Rufibacter radiotolerans]